MSTTTTTSTRRLSARRGSVSANDPWAKHGQDTDAEASCRLSIMRVGLPPPITLKQPPAHRLSFASSSFKDRGHSPRRQSQSTPQNLTPDELVQLARPNTMASPPLSPTFTMLPDDIMLPFLDRPSEVQSLISSPPTAKLFALLQLTFKNHPDGNPPVANSDDPANWSYPDLYDWLVKTDRDFVPDSLWVSKIRTCVLAHSELIWERLKGALGVPPELDMNYPSDDDINTSDLEDDGRKAKGHWDDWDAVMDSPIFNRLSPFPPMGMDRTTSPLVIEPILSSPASSPFFGASLPSPNASLRGIAEEEETSGNNTMATNTPEETNLLSPSNIHGLTISTSPTSPAPVRARALSPAATRRPSMENRRPSHGGSPTRSGAPSSPIFVPHRSRSRPSSISSFSSLSLGAYPLGTSVEERTSPLFPTSFAGLKAKVNVK